MNNDATRNDFIIFQNEILGDLKQLETKLMDKLAKALTVMENQAEKNENKMKEILVKFDLLAERVDKGDKTHQFEEAINLSQQRSDELITKVDIKLGILEKDFTNACFKYDKIFTNNLIVPGLIGTSCPYADLRPFLDYTNKKLVELIKFKERQIMDTKKYKEKMENLIAQNKTHFETAQNKFSDYCHQGFEQCEIICKDRMNVIEKRIETMRLENGKHALDLKSKAEELHIEWDKLNNIENNINKIYKDEVNKFKELLDKIENKVNKSNSEYNIMKKKFTELSEFIKDVRFKRNMDKLNSNSGEIYKERRQYREMADNIDFTKKHKIKKINIEKHENENDNYNTFIRYDEEEENNKDYNDEDINNNENSEHINAINNNINKSVDHVNEIHNYNNKNKNNERINEINNNNNSNIKNIIKGDINKKRKKEIKEDNNKSKVIDDISNKKKDKMIQKNFFIENNNFNSFNNFNNFNTSNIRLNKSLQNKSMNEIFNKSSDFHNSTSNNYNNYGGYNTNIVNIKLNPDRNKKDLLIKKSNNNKKINKNINTSTSMYFNNNDSNIYNVINYSRNYNDNKRISHYNELKSDNIGGNQRHFVKEKREQIKNHLILLAENAKINNLILGADFKRNSSLYNGPTFNLSQAYLMVKKKTEEMQKMKKYNMGKSEPKVNQHSPSSSMNTSKNLNNKHNYFPKKGFQNKSEFFYTSLKKEKIKKISSTPNFFFNLTNHQTTNNIYKNNYPKIFKDKNEITNANNPVELNTININDTHFDNKPLTQNSRNTQKIQKKIINSSSVDDLLVKVSPFSSNINEYMPLYKNKKDYTKLSKNSKEGNVKDNLNNINPYLFQKFKDS